MKKLLKSLQKRKHHPFELFLLYFQKLNKFIFYRAFEKFLQDSSLLRGNAIAYSVLLSIIPVLTVFIKYAEVDQDFVRNSLIQFMASQGMPDSTEILVIFDGILKQANTIAGIGTIFTIYAATNTIRHLETACNHIFKTKNRPLFYRFSIHISSIVLLPGILILMGSSIVFLFRALEVPEFTSITGAEGKIWITDTKGYLHSLENDKLTSFDISKKINTNVPFRNLYFDPGSNTYGRGFEMGITAEPEQIKKSDYYDIHKSQAYESSIYMIAKDGIVFFSENSGRTWDYYILNVLSENSIYRQPYLEDLRIDEKGNVLILSTLGSHSILFTFTKKSGIRSHRFTAHLNRIHKITKGNSSFRPGLYLSGNGIYVYSERGQFWTRPLSAEYGGRKLRITTLKSHEGGRVYFAGYRGAYWYNENDNNYFPNIRTQSSGLKENVSDLIFLGGDQIILYGDQNLFRYSMDAGKTWLLPENPILSDTSFSSHLNLGETTILAGENETLLLLNGPSITGKLDARGFPLVKFNLKKLQQRSPILSFLYKIGIYAIILLFLILLFLCLYLIFPNTKVQLFPALTGSIFSSTALFFFILIFQKWFSLFSGTAYFYGIWAIIPVGMLILLISIQIILYGLEISYIMQFDNKIIGRNNENRKK